MLLLTALTLVISCGYLAAASCGGHGGNLNDHVVIADGWKAVDSGNATQETILVRGTVDDEYQCLRQCRAADPRCRLVSYNHDTQKCVGFTSKGLPVLTRDIFSILVAYRQKLSWQPIPKAYHGGDDIPAGPHDWNLEQVNTDETCRNLCQVHPRCNYAVYNGNIFICHLKTKAAISVVGDRAYPANCAGWIAV